MVDLAIIPPGAKRARGIDYGRSLGDTLDALVMARWATFSAADMPMSNRDIAALADARSLVLLTRRDFDHWLVNAYHGFGREAR